jgi:hypothetical protein
VSFSIFYCFSIFQYLRLYNMKRIYCFDTLRSILKKVYFEIIKKLELQQKLKRFLIFGIFNNFLLFFYNIFSLFKNSFFVSQNIDYSGFFFETRYLEVVILLFISTLCFSWFLKKKGHVFQQKIFNVFDIMPRFVFYCIKIEYFLSKNLFVGFLVTQSVVFIVFFLFFIGWGDFVFFQNFYYFYKTYFPCNLPTV